MKVSKLTGDIKTGGHNRCQPWRAKRRLVVPSSREAALFSRRALLRIPPQRDRSFQRIVTGDSKRT